MKRNKIEEEFCTMMIQRRLFLCAQMSISHCTENSFDQLNVYDDFVIVVEIKDVYVLICTCTSRSLI